jgi:hypothetical protein
MRLTRETLIKTAHDTASQRARVSRRIVCIYLTGSLLDDSPLLGGTTDIDLVIIHDSEPLQAREVVRLTDEIHLDISHFDQAVFHQPRHLRADPWLGPFIYSKPMVFHDTQHWFDFIQASTGAQFFQPDYILQRASSLSQAARQCWMDLTFNSPGSHPQRVSGFLDAVENAGNALVSLTDEGKPLAERRFLLQFPQRMQALNQPDLISGLISLFLPQAEKLEEAWGRWVPAWSETFKEASAQENIPAQLQPCRYLYYQRAISALWEESHGAALWPLLRSWTRSAGQFPDGSPEMAGWQSACQALALDEDHFDGRMQALDQYLDRVEEALDVWARANGVSRTAEV